MLDLPWTTVRGLHALKALANEGSPMTLGAIARAARVPAARASRLLHALKDAGLVEASGRRWTLARRPDEITLLRALEALGPDSPRPERCHADWATCADRGGCPIAPLCRQAHERLVELFAARTLADLHVEAPALF